MALSFMVCLPICPQRVCHKHHFHVFVVVQETLMGPNCTALQCQPTRQASSTKKRINLLPKDLGQLQSTLRNMYIPNMPYF